MHAQCDSWIGSRTSSGAPLAPCRLQTYLHLSQLLFKPARNKTVATYGVVLAAEEGASGPVNDLLLQLQQGLPHGIPPLRLLLSGCQVGKFICLQAQQALVA